MKVEGWEAKLTQYIKDKQKEPFLWGNLDCATFVAGAFEVMTGNIIKVPNYTDKNTAETIIKNFGSYENIMTFYSKSNPVTGTLAQFGDLVMLYDKNLPIGKVVGICLGRKCVFLSGSPHNPFIFIGVAEMTYCWKL